MLTSLDLQDGESILWQGKPSISRILSSADIVVFPLSILFAGMTALFWEIGGVSAFGPIIIALTIGSLYNCFGRFVYKRFRKKRTSYFLTNHRALVVVGTRINQSISVSNVRYSWSLKHKYCTVSFDNTKVSTDLDYLFTSIFTYSSFLSYQNSGYDWWSDIIRKLSSKEFPLKFYDLTDVEELKLQLTRGSRSQ